MIKNFPLKNLWKRIITIEAVSQRCSVKKVFLEISQNSKENNCARKITLSLLFSCRFCEITKNAFSYWTPPVAPSNYYRYLSFFSHKTIAFLPFKFDRMKFLVRNFCSKSEQIRRKLQICSHLQKKSSRENLLYSVGW